MYEFLRKSVNEFANACGKFAQGLKYRLKLGGLRMMHTA